MPTALVGQPGARLGELGSCRPDLRLLRRGRLPHQAELTNPARWAASLSSLSELEEEVEVVSAPPPRIPTHPVFGGMALNCPTVQGSVPPCATPPLSFPSDGGSAGIIAPYHSSGRPLAGLSDIIYSIINAQELKRRPMRRDVVLHDQA